MSTAVPTRGRIIEVTSNRWEGKRPAIIVSVGEGPEARPVRANVLLDGETDKLALAEFRGDEDGNTVTLDYGVQNPNAAEHIPIPQGRDHFLGWWMPFQVGMAPASLAVQGELTAAKESIDRLKDALGFMAQKLNKEGDSHPRAKLYSSVMRIIDGKDPEDGSGRQVLLLSKIAKANHEVWLTGGDRGYSPYNKPWNQLTPQEQNAVAGTVRNTLAAVYAAMGCKVEHTPIIEDDLAQPTSTEPVKQTTGE